MGDITKLIAQVEALTGADREVDALICLATGWTAPVENGICGSLYVGRDKFEWHDPSGNAYGFYPPKLTASLDAAMALAVKLLDNGSVDIEVAHRSVGGKAFGRAEICGPHVGSAARGFNPAIALILATLKALQAKEVE